MKLEPIIHSEVSQKEKTPIQYINTYIGEGNGNPLQSSCLENPRDGEAWWAAIYGVTQSQTQLKRLSSSSKQLGIQKDGDNDPIRETAKETQT